MNSAPALTFTLRVELDRLGAPDSRAAELGRILRYWAGASKDLDLGQPSEQPQPVLDSHYQPVGDWRITAG